MSKIVVSIINFRTAELTCDCVRSVLDDMGDLNVEIVVVDNASDDGSVEYIEQWCKAQRSGRSVRVVRSETNSGFSGGHNQGIAAADGDYYLVLNSDSVLRPGFLREILRVAEATPNAGLISPSILSGEGVVQVGAFRFHSPLSELIRAAETGPVTRLFGNHVVALTPPADIGDIEWVSFACVLLRAQMVHDIGPMDEGYFLYFEDSEYCLRARRAGWKVACAYTAAAVHYQGGSGTLVADEMARKRLPDYYYASRTRFMYQAHGTLGLWAANLLWYVGRLFAQARRMVGKPVPPAVADEYRDLWINATKPLGPRYAPWEKQ